MPAIQPLPQAPHRDNSGFLNFCDRAEALALLSEFSDNVSAAVGWSAALGGTRADGSPAYQEMTEIVMEATRGRYRPTLELRVRPDMPDRVWEAAFDSLASGNGQPAFYNEMEYLAGLRDPALGLAEKDLVEWNGGGCTETMIHGCSNVGSLDAGFNLPLVLAASLRRTLADDAVTFEAVREGFCAEVRETVREVLGQLNLHFAARAKYRPQPVRSLLMDDCVDRGLDFNNGGARYNWSVINVAGMTNVADSLAALRAVVFGERTVTPRQLRDILDGNFEGQEPLRRRLQAVPKFGNDEAGVDGLAAGIADFVYREIRAYPCARGGRFLPANIMFETYVWAGAPVPATPDGRRAGEPLADSAGPVQGGDTHGCTAMLQSVARLPLRLALGTPVLNLRFAKASLAGEESRRRLRALIETYFKLGGLQLQISVLDRAELEDALVHPERHENLMVRIGGYSTFFNRLSLELKHEVLKRTEYTF
jgi:formate C-acetyltransferase